MTLLLGLDIGSTVIKAVLFDRRGRTVAAAEQAVAVRQPRPGWVERDAGKTWQVAAAMLRRVTRGRTARIRAVGVTGCGNGAVFLDRRLRPLRAGILSSDTRAASFVPRPDRRAGQRAYPGQLPVLLGWLRAAEPAAARRLAHAVFWKDFIRARLTGLVCSDYTDAGAAGLLEFPRRRPRCSDPVLPPLRESLGVGGGVTPRAAGETGLKSGTPVFTGCIDCEAVAIGSGMRAAGEVSVVAGTWAINQTYVARPPRSGGHFLVNASVEPDRWLVLEGSPASSANLDWACGILGGGRDPGAAVTAATRTPRSGLLFIPRVPTGQGAFIGLGTAHRREDLLRAVLEGVVFAHRAHLEELPVGSGPGRRVILAGGAARSPAWCQLFADGFGCRVDVPRGAQLGALGAAICAGTGAGLWPSVAAAQRAMVPRQRAYYPDARRHAALSRDYARYRRCLRSLAL